MALPRYPNGLPLPLRENYKREPVNNIRSTPMDSGRSRQRIEFRNVPDMIELSWIFTAPQATLFEAWVAQVVGAGWFMMPLLSPMGFDDEEVRFKTTPVGGELTGRYLWRYSVICESRKRPLIDPGWAEILPEYILYADIFDYAMNREWPLNPWQTYIEVMDTAINEDWPKP